MRVMKVLAAFALLAATAFAASPTTDIKVDQVGYLPSAPKIGLVASGMPATDFTVRRSSDDSVVLSGKLSPPEADADSGDHVQAADFSALRDPGRYYLDVANVGRSWNFQIAPDVYARAFYLAMRSYYGQRCGTAVDLGPEFPGYKHAACHLDGQYHATSGETGPHPHDGKGWHDAGDYGRYVVNSGISTGTLLWTYEMFGSRIQKKTLNLPESGNGTPDILNEIRWNLDWMLSMQASDGGVWHKQTSESFCGFIMPENDKLTSYVIGTGAEPFKSSCATGDFAAVMAIAARVYRPFDPNFSNTALAAAKRAWAWLEKNPAVLFHNPKGISTGDYGDRDCADEIFWAAAELWRTTRDAPYEQYFAAHAPGFMRSIGPSSPPNWGNVAALGLWTYALSGVKTPLAEEIRSTSVEAAGVLVARTRESPYHHDMTTKDYNWGSNSNAANYGLQLLVANALHPDPGYINAATENLHYLLGRNTFSLSFVTQVGEHPFQHPHHRPSASGGLAAPWPGLLSGGPNHAKQDSEMRTMPDLPPAKMYLDRTGSYASNEIAINWNAPLVFLLAGLLPAQ
ncbi:MAG: glycoside hydrolase family 9 protein [Bryobacteraceae bacterium]